MIDTPDTSLLGMHPRKVPIDPFNVSYSITKCTVIILSFDLQKVKSQIRLFLFLYSMVMPP